MACLLAACVAWTTGLVPSAAWAGRSPSVRVLLVESRDPVSIGVGAATQRVGLAREGRGLVVDGQAVGPVWSPRGEGLWQVDGARYRGSLELRALGGKILVVNQVQLEDYVAATVGGEMPASWPEQALRAQAVATRTYVLHQRDRRQGEPWDVRATVQSQVYRGLGSESPPTRRAADATRGEVLTHAGRPILAAFHSTSGGRTASASEVWGKRVPYLGSVDVQYEEDAPFTYWRTVIPAETLDDLFDAMGANLGPVHAIEVDGRTESGRVERLIATGGSRRIYIRGEHLRTLVESLGLRSRLFDIRDTPEGFAFVGSGHGHGVGMSQWGARELARRGAPYQRILARFYPGARLETWRSERVASRSGAEKQGR